MQEKMVRTSWWQYLVRNSRTALGSLWYRAVFELQYLTRNSNIALGSLWYRAVFELWVEKTENRCERVSNAACDWRDPWYSHTFFTFSWHSATLCFLHFAIPFAFFSFTLCHWPWKLSLSIFREVTSIHLNEVTGKKFVVDSSKLVYIITIHQFGTLVRKI